MEAPGHVPSVPSPKSGTGVIRLVHKNKVNSKTKNTKTEWELPVL